MGYPFVAALSDDLLLPTLSCRALGGLVVFVCPPGRDIADAGWERYLAIRELGGVVHKASP